MREPKTLATKTHGLIRKAVAGTLGATLVISPLIPAAMAMDYADGRSEIVTSEDSAQASSPAESTEVTPSVTETEKPAVVEYKGMQLVEKFKITGILTLEEIKQIDLITLKTIDLKTYEKIAALKVQLEAEVNKPVEPIQPDPEDSSDSSGEGGAEDSGDASDSSGEEGSDGSQSDEQDSGLETPEDPNPSDNDGGAEAEDVENISNVKKNAPSSETESVAIQTPLPEIISDVLPENQDPFDPLSSYPEWSYSGDVSFEIHHYTDDLTTEKFIAVIGEQAKSAAEEFDVSPRALIAYAVYASASGQSELAKAPYRNVFALMEKSSDHMSSQTYLEYSTYKECFKDMAQRVCEMRENRPQNESEIFADGISFEASDEEYLDYMNGLYAADMETIKSLAGLDEDELEAIDSISDAYELSRFDKSAEYELACPVLLKGADEAGNAVTYEMDLTDLVANVTSHLGVPYVWGGTTTSGFDCSGLVQYAYSHALGIGIPRTTYYQCTQGLDVDFSDLHAGDLVFFQKKGVVGHVGMYLGDGYYVEAPKPGSEVKVTSLEEKTPSFAKRLLPTVPLSN